MENNYTSSTGSGCIGATVNYDCSNGTYSFPGTETSNSAVPVGKLEAKTKIAELENKFGADKVAFARDCVQSGVKPGTSAWNSFAKKSKFTLIELLVVVGIISILAAMLLPVLGKAREKAKRVVCAGQIDQLNKGNIMYSGDNDSFVFRYVPSNYSAIPRAAISTTANGPEGLAILQEQSAFGVDTNGFKKLATCPSEERTTLGSTAGSINNYPLGNAGSSLMLMNLTDAMAAAHYGGDRNSDAAKRTLLKDSLYVDKKYLAIISCYNDSNIWCHQKQGLNAARVDGSVRWIGKPNLCDPLANKSVVIDAINEELK